MYLVWIKWIFEESRVSLGLVFLNQNFYLSRSQWWFFISHTKCPAVHLWSLTQLLCLKVPQRTDVDAWWVFYSVNGNCEAKTTTKKKTIMIICVWELRQPSTCFFFHQQRAWPWILYWYFVNLPQTLPSFHSFLLQLKLCHGLYIHLIIISLTPYDYKTRLELLGGHQLMFL